MFFMFLWLIESMFFMLFVAHRIYAQQALNEASMTYILHCTTKQWMVKETEARDVL